MSSRPDLRAPQVLYSVSGGQVVGYKASSTAPASSSPLVHGVSVDNTPLMDEEGERATFRDYDAPESIGPTRLNHPARSSIPPPRRCLSLGQRKTRNAYRPHCPAKLLLCRRCYTGKADDLPLAIEGETLVDNNSFSPDYQKPARPGDSLCWSPQPAAPSRSIICKTSISTKSSGKSNLCGVGDPVADGLSTWQSDLARLAAAGPADQIRGRGQKKRGGPAELRSRRVASAREGKETGTNKLVGVAQIQGYNRA